MTDESIPVSDNVNWESCEQISFGPRKSDDDKPYDEGIHARGVERLPSPDEATAGEEDGPLSLELIPPVLEE